jgi:TolA-binding protein
MLDISNTIKAIVALIIVLVLATGFWYVTNIKADLVASEADKKKLEEGIDSQKEVIDQMKSDISQIQNVNEELRQQNYKRKQDVDNLKTKFSEKNLGKLASERPEVIERLVNRGTENVARCFELASGAPLNEKELNAKTAMEANRECPNLVNRNFNSTID